MNPIPAELLERGLEYASYRRRITKNLEAFDDVYASPTCDDHDRAFLGRLPPLTVVTIAEVRQQMAAG